MHHAMHAFLHGGTSYEINEHDQILDHNKYVFYLPTPGIYDNTLGRISFSSPGGVLGRYVVVQRLSEAFGNGRYLELADVQVFVRPTTAFPRN